MSQASFMPPRDHTKIPVGISSCLLGEPVRYDRGHKRSAFITDILAAYFDFRPVCPEVAIGLGVPRPPIRLAGDPERPRAVGVRDPRVDVTAPLRAYGERMAGELDYISGYIFKSKSPSCGLFRVKVYGESGRAPSATGRGLYAQAITEANPLLPVEEEGRLNDPVLRENFIGRVYAYHRWQTLLAEGVTAERLVDFHTAHKLILMAHGRQGLREMGRLVAQAGHGNLERITEAYGALFMRTLTHKATRRRHTDVLFHLLGYLKRTLESDEKAEAVELIHDYREGRVPLIVPVTLLRHHFRKHPEPYVERQLYLHWQPAGLGLWNAI
ncbi:YbgA family protein [Alkalilimnicola ehrlichii]|uniref:YbgA family protein n=1 Tax=Alkalilimnicola ehrlichii TaxID=351052 RepID=UPI003BA28838